jgi:hypothetical protein
MHQRCQHRDHRDLQGLDDRLEHQRLEHRIPELRLDVGYQNQHRLDVEHHLGEEHRRLDVEHHPVLGERQQRRLDEEHQLDVGHGPCPGWS